MLCSFTLQLQDDLNPLASDVFPKRIALPPLVTLPHCQTQVVTNVSMSLSSPEDKDCVVDVKFLGYQISFCRRYPAYPVSKQKWTNLIIDNPCFHSSRLIFSEKDQIFYMLSSGCDLIGSWGLIDFKPKLHRLHYENTVKREFQYPPDLLYTAENLVESQSTCEMFIVKSYKLTEKINKQGVAEMKTVAVNVFKLDIEQGKSVYTQDIGDLAIFVSQSEFFCVTPSSCSSQLPCVRPNQVYIWDNGEMVVTNLSPPYHITSFPFASPDPYLIPPQNVVEKVADLLAEIERDKGKVELFKRLQIIMLRSV
ncbi:unnamed protein product [Cochlearia groenlandica]